EVEHSPERRFAMQAALSPHAPTLTTHAPVTDVPTLIQHAPCSVQLPALTLDQSPVGSPEHWLASLTQYVGGTLSPLVPCSAKPTIFPCPKVPPGPVPPSLE